MTQGDHGELLAELGRLRQRCVRLEAELRRREQKDAPELRDLLVGLLGQVELALAGLKEGTPEHQALREIEKSARRAAELAHQVLAASSGDEVPQEIDASVFTEWSGGGTVLVVDDEPSVRSVVAATVAKVGFKTLEAADGKEGLETFRAHAEEIRAVCLDLTMPRLDGREAFREIHRLRPEVPVLLFSGYSEEEAARRFGAPGLAGFVHKPFRPRELLEKLRRALDAA